MSWRSVFCYVSRVFSQQRTKRTVLYVSLAFSKVLSSTGVSSSFFVITFDDFHFFRNFFVSYTSSFACSFASFIQMMGSSLVISHNWTQPRKPNFCPRDPYRHALTMRPPLKGASQHKSRLRETRGNPGSDTETQGFSAKPGKLGDTSGFQCETRALHPASVSKEVPPAGYVSYVLNHSGIWREIVPFTSFSEGTRA